MSIQYPKGSEWRKWDLHIHTPETKLNDQFKLTDQEKMDGINIWHKWFDTLIDNQIECVGATDYFSVDGFRKAIDEKEKYIQYYKAKRNVFEPNSTDYISLTKNIKALVRLKIFPNVELRLDTKNKKNEHINFHIIFSNEFDKDNNNGGCQKDKLKLYQLSKLESFFTYLEITGASGITHADKLEGDKNYSHLSTSIEKIILALKNSNILENNIDKYLFGLTSNGYGGVRFDNDDDDNISTTQKIIEDLEKKIPVSLMIESNDNIDTAKKTQIYYLGNVNKTKRAVVNTSDAHFFDNMQKNKFTWIKADPTFEGLKQITYEPEQRVHIGSVKPDNKNLYQIISSIKLIHPNFLEKEILINDNFASIIGCRSSGKSLLMYHIAKAINPDEVKNRFEEMQKELPYQIDTNIQDQNVIDFSKFDLIVHWKDDNESQLSQQSDNEYFDDKIQNIDDNRKPNITYIPQGYLSFTAERNQDAIDSILLKFLMQNESFKKEKNNFDASKNHISHLIDEAINNMFDIIRLAHETKGEIKKRGNKDSIKKNIIHIELQLKDVSGRCDFTEEDMTSKIEWEKELTNFQLMQENIQSDIENQFSEKDYQHIINEDFIFKKLSLIKTNNKNKEELRLEINKATDNFKVALTEVFSKYNQKLEGNKRNADAQCTKITGKLSPIREKLKAQFGINALQKQLNEENKKISQITQLESKLSEYVEKFKEHKSNLKTLLMKRLNTYESFIELVHKFTETTKNSNIDTTISFEFNGDSFLNYLKSKVNKVKHKKIDEDIAFEKIQNNFNNSEYESFIDAFMKIQHDIIKSTESGKIFLNNSGQDELNTKKEVLLKLLSDYFKINYNVRYEGDTLKNMSTGKRSIFLLKLIMELSNNKHPILIDQPEDDLDNSSVYHELVEFIKTKKKERQIIIVTHNPNLVIGTDAEQVIVGQQLSNQSGKKFNYIYGAIENSFERNKDSDNIADHGIKQNICRILEGGDTAFLKREKRYGIN
jgi:hypothetical protein